MPLVVLHLEGAQDLVAEADRMDHQGQHVGRASARSGRRSLTSLITIGSRVSTTSCRRAASSAAAARPGSPGPRELRIDQRHVAPGHPIDPEVAPIEQPVGQPLDLGKRSLERGIAGDSRLHQVDLVQVLRADRLIQNLPGEQTQRPRARAPRPPSRPAPACQRGDHDGAGDQGEQVGADLPAQDEDLLGALQLVADQQAEVEEGPAEEEVERDQDRRGRAGNPGVRLGGFRPGPEWRHRDHTPRRSR